MTLFSWNVLIVLSAWLAHMAQNRAPDFKVHEHQSLPGRSRRRPFRQGPRDCRPRQRQLLPPKTFRAYILFRQIFSNFVSEFAKFQQIFSAFLKYENLDIFLSKIIEILRNSGKNPLKFDEKTAKSAASSENQQKLHEILQKWCKGPEKLEKSGMVQRKKCRAWKMLKNAPLIVKIGVDTDENEPRKGSKKCML